MDLGAMTVSLRADLSGLEAGLRRAQELVGRSGEALAQQEERFRQAGAAARDYGSAAVQWLTGASDAASGLGRSAVGLQQRWAVTWEALDGAAQAALMRVTRRFGRAVADMIVDGDGLRRFWRGLWRDLVEIAVERLLQMVLQARGAAGAMRDALGLVGGGLFGGAGGLLGGLFGGIGQVLGKLGSWFGFDSARHDAWARKQGFDFGHHFRTGVAAAMAMPVGAPASLSPTLAIASIGSIGRGSFRAVSVQPGAFQVSVYAQQLNERVVREAGDILADEVSRRLGWTDRRSGV